MFTETMRNGQELTDANKQTRFKGSGQLLRRYPASLVNLIWFTDEKLFTVVNIHNVVNIFTSSNNQDDRMYVYVGTRKRDVPSSRLVRTRPTFSKSLMVSVGISALGRTSIHFIEPGVKVNEQYYITPTRNS